MLVGYNCDHGCVEIIEPQGGGLLIDTLIPPIQLFYIDGKQLKPQNIHIHN